MGKRRCRRTPHVRFLCSIFLAGFGGIWYFLIGWVTRVNLVIDIPHHPHLLLTGLRPPDPAPDESPQVLMSYYVLIWMALGISWPPATRMVTWRVPFRDVLEVIWTPM